MATSGAAYYNFILSFNFCVGTLFLPIIMYLILRHSGQMNRYKYFLANVVIWMYLLELCAFFLKPRFLTPTFCMGFQPLFSVSKITLWCILNFTLVALINTETGLVGLIIYRYLKAYPGRLSKSKS
jgi:hypothetical protein